MNIGIGNIFSVCLDWIFGTNAGCVALFASLTLALVATYYHMDIRMFADVLASFSARLKWWASRIDAVVVRLDTRP